MVNPISLACTNVVHIDANLAGPHQVGLTLTITEVN